jgi:hypothetical protein
MDGGVVGRNRRPGSQQAPTNGHAGGVAEVVGAGLECETPHGNTPTSTSAFEMLGESADHTVKLLFVTCHRALELCERLTKFTSHVGERPSVLW